MEASRDFLAWPGKAHLGFAFGWMVFTAIVFWAVYWNANAFTVGRAARWNLFFDWETRIPFWVPAFIVYNSLYGGFCLTPFIFRTRDSFQALAVACLAAIGISGIFFFLVPARLGFSTPEVPGAWGTLVRLTDQANLDFNLVPSLHVGLAVVLLSFCAGRANLPGRIVIVTWGLALALSTLFTHQHHLIDAVTGAIVGWAAFVIATRRPSFRKAAV